MQALFVILLTVPFCNAAFAQNANRNTHLDLGETGYASASVASQHDADYQTGFSVVLAFDEPLYAQHGRLARLIAKGDNRVIFDETKRGWVLGYGYDGFIPNPGKTFRGVVSDGDESHRLVVETPMQAQGPIHLAMTLEMTENRSGDDSLPAAELKLYLNGLLVDSAVVGRFVVPMLSQADWPLELGSWSIDPVTSGTANVVMRHASFWDVPLTAEQIHELAAAADRDDDRFYPEGCDTSGVISTWNMQEEIVNDGIASRSYVRDEEGKTGLVRHPTGEVPQFVLADKKHQDDLERPAREWFVSPLAQRGAYGDETKANYGERSNPFNGLGVSRNKAPVYRNVDPGGIDWSKIQPGDTLWVMGDHFATKSKDVATVAQATYFIGVDGMTIRMDHPDQSGTLYGYMTGWNRDWGEQSDENGVWSLSEDEATAVNHINGLYLLIDHDNDPATAAQPQKLQFIHHNDGRGKKTWSDTECAAPSYSRFDGQIFVKTGDVQSPGNRLLDSRYIQNWRWDYRRNLTFIGCRFVGFQHEEELNIVADRPRSHRLTFRDCLFTDHSGPLVIPHAGNDHYVFENCEFRNAGSGVYTRIRKGPTGTAIEGGGDHLTVRNCYFHDIGDWEFPDQDSHGVGVQSSNHCLIEDSTFERTGAAIEFWASDDSGLTMHDNTVQRNLIENTWDRQDRKYIITLGAGITFSGSNPDRPGRVTGTRGGNIIRDNIIRNTAGSGIRSNNPDSLVIEGNTITHSGRNQPHQPAIRIYLTQDPLRVCIERNKVIDPHGGLFLIKAEGDPIETVIDGNQYEFTPNSSPPTNLLLYGSGSQPLRNVTWKEWQVLGFDTNSDLITTSSDLKNEKSQPSPASEADDNDRKR